MFSDECTREDHINGDDIGDCPRCDSKNVHIQESLYVTDFCDEIHLVDSLECLKCGAIISLDILLRLLQAEEELKRYLQWGKEHGVTQTGAQDG